MIHLKLKDEENEEKGKNVGTPCIVDIVGELLKIAIRIKLDYEKINAVFHVPLHYSSRRRERGRIWRNLEQEKKGKVSLEINYTNYLN